VLEVGCGTGTLAAALAERWAAKVWAVDPSAEMLAVARGRVPRTVGLKQAAAEELPFRDGWFERVAARLVLHLVDRRSALAEVRRVLASGGRFVAASFDPTHFDGYWLNRFFPELLELDLARFPGADALSAELAAAELVPGASERLVQRAAVTREDALDRIRGRYISTLRLLPDDVFRTGLERAEAGLPERVDYELRWLLVAADVPDSKADM
jgi:SAM-dependent methyltransferase